MGFGATVGAAVGAAVDAGLLQAAARPSMAIPPAAVENRKNLRRETACGEYMWSDNSVSPSD